MGESDMDKNGFIKKTLMVSFIIICLLLISAGILTWTGLRLAESMDRNRQALRADCLADYIENMGPEQESAENFLQQNLDSNNKLMTDALRSFVRDDKYTGPRVFNDSFIAEIKDGRVDVPAGAPAGLEHITPAMITDEQSLPVDRRTALPARLSAADRNTVDVVLSCANISGNYYYVDWIALDEIHDYINIHYDYNDVLGILEDSFEERILLVDTSSEDLALLNRSLDFPDAVNAGEIGFTREMLAKEVSEFRSKDDQLYYCSYKKLRSFPYTIIVLRPLEAGFQARYFFLAFLVTGLMLVIFVVMTVYVTSVRRHIQEKILSEAYQKRYQPRRIRLTLLIAGIFGCLAVFACATFFHAIGSLQDVTQHNKETMSRLLGNLEMTEKKRESESADEEERWLTYYGEHIVSALAVNPSLATKDQLYSFCQDLDADYMMIFDQQGNEVLSSNGYTGFTLDMFNNKGETDFTLLLKGIPEVVQKPEKSKVTGLTHQMIGVTIPAGQDQVNNGALIMAFSPDRTKHSGMNFDIVKELGFLVPVEDLCFAIKEKTGTVSVCSDSSFVGLTAKEIGLQERDLKDGFMDFFKTRGTGYYGISIRRSGSTLCYYARHSADMIKSILIYGLTGLAVFAVIYAVLMLYLLRGYDQLSLHMGTTKGKDLHTGPVVEVASDDGRWRKAVDPSRRFVFTYRHWNDLYPEQKAGSVGRIMLLAYLCFAMIFGLTLSYRYAHSNLMGFIMSGDWTRGFNLFAVCASIITVFLACIVVILSRFLLQALSLCMGTKGETLCRLLYNFIQYGAFFTALYYIFGYLGFDTTAILASLGLVTLTLSLGAKDMVADILAGITIIFEGDLQVGDIVEIDGYRGMIQDIGVRTTKIIGDGNNIRILNNRDIKSITNMTRMNSWYVSEITINEAESLVRVEAILEKELEPIGKRNKKIISGPFYKGVVRIDSTGAATISIITECKEEDFNTVKRFVNRELRLLFKRENINM